MNIRPFSIVLTFEGFQKDYDTRAGGGRTVQFSKVVGDRKLELQLFDDGQHRVSHFLNGRMSTHPTEFKNPQDMLVAIAHELKRTDHPEPKR